MAYWDKDYWSVMEPSTWFGGGGWREGSPVGPQAERQQWLNKQPMGVDPANMALLKAINPVSMVGTALDTTSGARATRGVVAGRPREVLSLVPGSDQFGLTSREDEQASHFGVVGDTLINPGSARMLGGLGQVGLAGLRGMVPGRATMGGLVPEAAQFVPRPGQVRSPNSGTFLPKPMPGASPRVRTKGGTTPPTVVNPQPARAAGPRGLPSPKPPKQLEDLDPVRAYEKLTAHWRDPFQPASAPGALADPGRAVAQGARASKEFGRLSQSANRVPDRPVQNYQTPPGVRESLQDPNRVIGTERAAAEQAIRAGIANQDRNANSLGNLATRAVTNIGQAAQNTGSRLIDMLRGGRGGGQKPDAAGAYVGFGQSRSPMAGWGTIEGTPAARMIPPANRPPVPGNQVGTVTDLMRRGNRIFKENKPGSEYQYRGVGGPPNMKSAEMQTYGASRAKEMAESSPGLLGFSQQGVPMRPGIGGVYQKPNVRFGGENRNPFGETVRHERVHAIMQEAQRRGPVAVDQLPPVMKQVTRMRMSDNPFTHTMGFFGDEAIARGLEKRGAMNQARNAAGFLFDANFPGRRIYAGQGMQVSPTAAAVFSALPKTVDAVAGSLKAAPAALMNAVQNGRADQFLGGPF